MKKILCLVAALVMAIACLAGCSGGGEAAEGSKTLIIGCSVGGVLAVAAVVATVVLIKRKKRKNLSAQDLPETSDGGNRDNADSHHSES